jgi:pimeloyl-ACP methyl ester carboxylesterase
MNPRTGASGPPAVPARTAAPTPLLPPGPFTMADCCEALREVRDTLGIDRPVVVVGNRFVARGARWIHGTGLYRDGAARAVLLPAARERDGAVLDDLHRNLCEADGAALARSVRAVLIEREPLAPRLRGIAAPTLSVAGRHDAMEPLEGLRDAVSHLPRGRFEVLETALMHRADEAAQDLQRWIEQGLLKAPEDIVRGLENAPAGLVGLLAGKHVGKPMVRVAREETP